jgi:hypothetical protein
MVAEKKHSCLECDIPATDMYLCNAGVNSYRLECDTMRIPKIPVLCACGCNQIVWKGNRYINGHNRPMKGKQFSDEHNRRISKSKKGQIAWNKGNTNWVTSEHKSKVAEANRRRVWKNESKQKLSQNLKGKKRTLLNRMNISKGRQGLKLNLSEDQRRRWSEIRKGKSKNKGCIRTEETKRKISKTRKKRFSTGEIKPHWLGKHLSDETKKKLSKASQGKYVGEKNPMYGQRGPLAPNWNGGTSFVPYCQKFNKQLKEKIRNRDNRTCQLCGVKENGKKLFVYHIHYDKENCYPDLIALCAGCNSKANGNRQYFEVFFMNKLNERGLLFYTKENS